MDSDDGTVSTDSSSTMFTDGEDEEGFVEDEAGDSAYNAGFPDSQDLFITLTEIPYQPSPARNPDPESGVGAVASTVSRPSTASTSQRLAKIRRRKKKTRDTIFDECVGCYLAEADQQRQWREKVSLYQCSHSEWEERWREEHKQATQAMLVLLREQTDMLRRLVYVLQVRCRTEPPAVSLQPPSPATKSHTPLTLNNQEDARPGP